MCGDFTAIPELKTLRARRLEAWAYTVLPPTHPFKAQLKPAYLQARARHELIKHEVLELVRAWNAVGIVPVIYKGFALSEFVYDQPGVRFHGDVDVLVQPEEFQRALEVGQAQGYRDPSVHLGWPFQNPHELPLRKQGNHAAFDVHQRLVHAALPWVSAEFRLTESAWQKTHLLEWEGTRIQMLSPEDNFLFGLVLARGWSSDDWRLKSHDLLDGFALIRRHQLRLETVQIRAKALNISRTLELFLARCHAWKLHLSLEEPTAQEKRSWDWRIVPEHLPQKWADRLALALRVGPMVWRVLNVSNLLLEASRQPKTIQNLKQGLRNLERPPRQGKVPSGYVLGSLWWAVRIFGLTSNLIWPMAAYAAMQRQGFLPVFKLGELHGTCHGWVELEGEPLPGFDLVSPNWREHRVIFEHSAPGSLSDINLGK